MKLPKKFTKMTNEEQRKWVSDRLAIVRNEEEALVKLYRMLVRDKGFTPIDVIAGLDYEKETN